jgi:hypothetical protein
LRLIVEPQGKVIVMLIQLDCEETKSVVGGIASRFPGPLKDRRLIGEIVREVVKVIEKDLGLGKQSSL